MNILILGPNGSGKSLRAEAFAAQLRQGRLIYIATMIPYGEEGRLRVERHREQRRELGFITYELPVDLRQAQLLATDTVLLEDVSNLTANMLFEAKEQLGPEAVLTEIRQLSQNCANLLLVSISGLKPDKTYDEATNHYIEVLCQVNQGLRSWADEILEMEKGIEL